MSGGSLAHSRLCLEHINAKFAISPVGIINLGEGAKKQARKSSEDAQTARYAQFEKVWAG